MSGGEAPDHAARVELQRAPTEPGVRLHTLERQSTQAHSDELGGLTPTLFEHVNPLGSYDLSTDRPAGELRPLRAASAAA